MAQIRDISGNPGQVATLGTAVWYESEVCVCVCVHTCACVCACACACVCVCV